MVVSTHLLFCFLFSSPRCLHLEGISSPRGYYFAKKRGGRGKYLSYTSKRTKNITYCSTKKLFFHLMSHFRNVVILLVIILSVYQSRNSSIIFLDMFIALLLHLCCNDNAVQQNNENYPGCTKTYNHLKNKKRKKRVSFTSQFIILQISMHIYFFNYR